MCTLPNRLVMALLMGLTLCGRAGKGDGHSLQWSQTDVLPHLRVRPGMSPSREAMWVESFSEQLSEPYLWQSWRGVSSSAWKLRP